MPGQRESDLTYLCLNCKAGRHTLCANFDPECYKPKCPCGCKGKQ